ncbi:hypothetical protein DFH08DRAFT_1086561 [Mycena albidolilacea]|uniref:Zn(2)-C6 fungal-type domain-containing protein n=1 Tax=Mycena albidolilacea TaxID=1033008 RepID=A0AAD6ZDY4_9AGAR|nr:hypothetical protein DFH08DRAFT_1086561 [Mycena albidolilacea]
MAPEKQERCRPLRRGKACLNCRHLKIKCNGIRPVCGCCTRVPKEDPCEYTDAMSRTQRLERTVARLQMRLKDLRNTGTTPPKEIETPQLLSSSYDPLTRRSSFGGSSSNSDNGSTFQIVVPRFQSSPSSVNSRLPSLEDPAESSDSVEPPFATTHMLLESFLPHATQFGFFLHPHRFRDAVLGRPSVALLDVVALWGAHLSKCHSLLSFEALFLDRARQHIAADVSADKHSPHYLHTIQALVLLSTYLLRTKQFIEAEFYANGAATLVLGHQLHKNRPSPDSATVIPVPDLEDVYHAPSTNALEEGEGVRAFWAVVCLQTHLKFSLDMPRAAAFCILESASGEISAPWPYEIEDYEVGMLLPGFSIQDSLHLLTESRLPPLCMLYAKASVLLHDTMRVSTAWSVELGTQYTTAYRLLDRRITAFWQALPPIYAYLGDDTASRTLAVTHALTAAAAIRLHRRAVGSDTTAQTTCLFAARAILDCLGDVRVGGPQAIAHPVVGALCALACGVLMDEVLAVRGFPVACEKGLFDAEEAELLGVLRAGMGTMEIYAQGCPLIQHQLQQLSQQYEML